MKHIGSTVCTHDMEIWFWSLLVFLSGACLPGQAWKTYDGYQVVTAHPSGENHLHLLHQLASNEIIDVGGHIKRSGDVEFLVSPEHSQHVLATLRNAGMELTITETNYGRVLKKEMKRLEEAKKHRRSGFDVNDWNDLDDINTQLTKWAESCDDSLECNVHSAGKSYEDRDIKVFKIGKKTDDIRKAVWLDATIHCREWISTGTLLKVIDHLVNKYDSDTEAKRLVDTYDWYIMPVLNPDGYVKTWVSDRFWRKNTRPDEDMPACIGVDLNRNYDVNFGKEGVNHFPCSTIFCGREGNSEPETKAVVAEVTSIAESQGILTFITYHGYGNMWMFPWGNTVNFNGLRCEKTEDHDDLMAVADATADAIQDTHNTRWSRGTSCEVIYPTTGGSDDWARNTLGVKYTFNPELRGRDFELDKSNIPLSFEENWNGLKAHIAKIEEIESKSHNI